MIHRGRLATALLLLATATAGAARVPEIAFAVHEEWRIPDQGRGEDLAAGYLLGYPIMDIQARDATVHVLNLDRSEVLEFARDDGHYMASFVFRDERYQQRFGNIVLSPRGGVDCVGVLRPLVRRIVFECPDGDSNGTPHSTTSVYGFSPSSHGGELGAQSIVPDRANAWTGEWIPRSIHKAIPRGDDVIASGKCSFRGRHEQGTLWFLARFDMAGTEAIRYFETTVDETDGTTYLETDRYFEIYQPWTVDAAGRIYLATDFHEYSIDVIDRDGTLRGRIVIPESTYQPLIRAEPQKVRSIVEDPEQSDDERRHLADEIRERAEAGRSAYDPCVRSMRISSSGELWVANGHCGQDPRDAWRSDVTVFRYDVFTPEGALDRRVAVEVPGQVPLGELHWLDDDEFVVVDTSDTIEIVAYRLTR
jgi:hypothetical protein